MELYRKKISIAGKTKPRPQDRFLRNDRYRYEIYLQKSIEQQNLPPQNSLINLSNINDSYPNFRTSMQDLFSNDESRRKAIKYVINARRRSPSPSGETPYFQRSVSTKSNNKKSKNNYAITESSPEFPKTRLGKSRETFSNLNTRNPKNLYNGNPNLGNLSNYGPLSYSNSNVNSVRRGQNKDNSRFNTSVSKDRNLREIKDNEISDENDLEQGNNEGSQNEMEDYPPNVEDNGGNSQYQSNLRY